MPTKEYILADTTNRVLRLQEQARGALNIVIKHCKELLSIQPLLLRASAHDHAGVATHKGRVGELLRLVQVDPGLEKFEHGLPCQLGRLRNAERLGVVQELLKPVWLREDRETGMSAARAALLGWHTSLHKPNWQQPPFIAPLRAVPPFFPSLGINV